MPRAKLSPPAVLPPQTEEKRKGRGEKRHLFLPTLGGPPPPPGGQGERGRRGLLSGELPRRGFWFFLLFSAFCTFFRGVEAPALRQLAPGPVESRPSLSVHLAEEESASPLARPRSSPPRPRPGGCRGPHREEGTSPLPISPGGGGRQAPALATGRSRRAPRPGLVAVECLAPEEGSRFSLASGPVGMDLLSLRLKK